MYNGIEFCDCTRNIKLPGKSLIDQLDIKNEELVKNNNFVDIGRLKLNRKKQIDGMQGLKNLCERTDNNTNLIPISAGAAISGLFAIFFDSKNKDYFRIKSIPDT